MSTKIKLSNLSTEVTSYISSAAGAYLDSAEAIALIDSDYVQARIAQLGSNTITTTGTITAGSFSGDGSGLTGVTSYVSTDFDSDFSNQTTDDLTEGSTNLYYTTARADSDAKAAISVTDAGGDGSLTYSSGTITYTGPSASETRAHFSAGTGVTLSSGQISIGQAVDTTDSVTFSGLTVSGDFTVSGTTTTVNSIAYTVTDPLLHLADSNETSDTVDIGFVGHYSDDGGSTKKHTGLFRDASDDKFKIFYGLQDVALDSSVPTNVIDIAGTGYTVATLVGNLEGNVTGDLTGDVTGNVTGTVSDISGDTSPQLGGDLDTNGNDIKFGDNDVARFGAATDGNGDLVIKHDGSNSYIIDRGTGEFYIQGSTNVSLQNFGGTKNYFVGANGGASTIYYDGSAKLATTSTGIDVTGTVTADGLTLGNANYIRTSDNASTGLRMFGMNSSNATYIGPIDPYAGGNVLYGASSNVNDQYFLTGGNNRLRIISNGDIQFYEDTGTTAKFYWDASAESLGIGTDSPDEELHVHGNIKQTSDADTNAFKLSKQLYASTSSTSAGTVKLRFTFGSGVRTGGIVKIHVAALNAGSGISTTCGAELLISLSQNTSNGVNADLASYNLVGNTNNLFDDIRTSTSTNVVDVEIDYVAASYSKNYWFYVDYFAVDDAVPTISTVI